MENLFVILLLSVVVLLSALYGYTVEQKIKKEIKDEIKEEGEFVKLVNAEIELKKEMKKVKDELEDVKSQLQEKDKAYRNEIYQIKQNMTVLLKETSIRYDNALQDLIKEIRRYTNSNIPSSFTTFHSNLIKFAKRDNS